MPLEDEAGASSHNHNHDDRHPILPSDGENNQTAVAHKPHAINSDEDDPDGQHWLADSSDSSLDETDIDMLEDANRDKNIYR